jgi:hypothetical protein
MLQLPQRLRLNLTNTLSRHQELLTDLLQRMIRIHADTKPHAQHALFARSERGQDARGGFAQVGLGMRMVRAWSAMLRKRECWKAADDEERNVLSGATAPQVQFSPRTAVPAARDQPGLVQRVPERLRSDERDEIALPLPGRLPGPAQDSDASPQVPGTNRTT